jgi:hypothetical protein
VAQRLIDIHRGAPEEADARLSQLAGGDLAGLKL